jgi:hypothetical protein
MQYFGTLSCPKRVPSAKNLTVSGPGAVVCASTAYGPVAGSPVATKVAVDVEGDGSAILGDNGTVAVLPLPAAD